MNRRLILAGLAATGGLVTTAFLQVAVAEGFLQHCGKVFARRRRSLNLSHEYSEPRD